MDTCVRYWGNEKGLVKTNYLDTRFLMRPNANNLHDKLYAALGDILEQKMLQLSLDGPKMNWRVLGLLNSFRGGKGMEWLIEYWKLWASCNTWCIQNRSEGNKMGHRADFEVNVENISWQYYPKANIFKNHRELEISWEVCNFTVLDLFCKWVIPHKTRTKKGMWNPPFFTSSDFLQIWLSYYLH